MKSTMAVFAAVVLYGILTSGTVYTQSGGRIHACVKATGQLRIVGPTDACERNEKPLNWSTDGAPAGCPPDSVPLGRNCIDKYEASLWQTTNAEVIAKIKEGTVTLGDLQAAGAVAVGDLATPNSLGETGCENTGNGCDDIYAVSVAGAYPAYFAHWFQAAAAARNSGKRLPTNLEWQTAALGTPDPGTDNGTTDCMIVVPGQLWVTGSRSNCVSGVGAFDMVGSLAEWVGDWVSDLVGDCGPYGTSGSGLSATGDYLCLPGQVHYPNFREDARVRALFRDFGTAGTLAGVFSVGTIELNSAVGGVGFRAIR